MIKTVHPMPTTESRRALSGDLLDKRFDDEKLPSIVRDFAEEKVEPSRFCDVIERTELT